MLEFDKDQQDNFSLLPNAESRFHELTEAYEKTFRSDEHFNSLVTDCADLMEEVYAVGLYPDSNFLISWLYWFSEEFERRQIKDATEIIRLGRVMLLCQTKEDMTNSINTYVFSALIPAKEFKEAESWLRKGAEQEVGTQSINCLSNLGVLHYEQERYDEALLEFLLVYSTNSNWNRAEAAFYLAHLVADSKCRENSVSQGLLLKVMSLSDSHYSKKARNCFAGKCTTSKKTFSRATSLKMFEKDFSEPPVNFVIGKDSELVALLSNVAERLEASGTVQFDADWRDKGISYWMQEIQSQGINARGLVEHLSEKLVGEIEALVILYAAGLTAEPDESLAMGLANCRFGAGFILPHLPEALRFNSLAFSGGFNFEKHKLFAAFSVENDTKSPEGSRLLTGLSASQKNYMHHLARRETYFGQSIGFTRAGAQEIYLGSILGKNQDKSHEISSRDVEALVLVDLISREFIMQLNQCILGERELSTISPEAICRDALEKIERFASPAEFDAESLMTRANLYSKERVDTAWALNGEGKRLRTYVSVPDLFGGMAISIAQGNLEWAIIQAGNFGVRDFQSSDNSIEDSYRQIFPVLQIIWPLCWSLGARGLRWEDDKIVPFDMKWSSSHIENSKDAETITFLLDGGQELEGHLPRIILGKEQQGDHPILSSMTDEELSWVARSKNLSLASIELIYPIAGPATLASLMLNSAVPNTTFGTSRWEKIMTSVEIAWLIARDTSEQEQKIEIETLDELTRAFSKTKNSRAAAKFASSPQLTDEHLRELALSGNKLVADAVLANPNSSDETKALARIGI